eukprot:3351661-Alexandrium_andersonii.AAC.1
MREGVGAMSASDEVVERRAKCLNELWAIKMGNWMTQGECEGALQYWGFKVGRTEDDRDEPLFTEMPPPFMPVINK